MTLTEILPTLRRSLPVPLAAHLWPVHTEATTVDIAVGGVSMMRLVEVGGTPAVLTGDLPYSLTGAHRTIGGTDVTVLVFTVALRVDTQGGKRIAVVDCALDGVDAHWTESRLIGRASTSRSAQIELLSRDQAEPSWPHPTAHLPSDLHEGDIVAVPCTGAVTLHDVRIRPATAHSEAVAR